MPADLVATAISEIGQRHLASTAFSIMSTASQTTRSIMSYESGRICETLVQYKGGCPTRSPFVASAWSAPAFLHNLAQVVCCDGRLIMHFPPVIRGVCAGRQVRTAQTRSYAGDTQVARQALEKKDR